jgi:uncharacterized protein YuzE
MEISYDPRYNIAYIRFRKKTKGVTTFRVSNEVNIDISPNGKIYGIELLNANEQLMKGKKFMKPFAGYPAACRGDVYFYERVIRQNH